MSNSLWPHGLQHARLPCLSPTPGACSNSCPLHWWCHPIISSSVIPFSSHLQSFSGSRSFPVSQLFASGSQGIRVSASASVLPMNIQDWFPLGWTDWIFLQSSGLSRVFSNTTVQKLSRTPELWWRVRTPWHLWGGDTSPFREPPLGGSRSRGPQRWKLLTAQDGSGEGEEWLPGDRDKDPRVCCYMFRVYVVPLNSRSENLPQGNRLVQRFILSSLNELQQQEIKNQLMLLDCGVGEDSWESPELQGDPTSPS